MNHGANHQDSDQWPRDDMGLTVKQRRVYELVQQGKSTRDIAAIIGVSTDAIDRQLRKIRETIAEPHEFPEGARLTEKAKARIAGEIATGQRCAVCHLLAPCDGIHLRPTDLAGARRGDETTIQATRRAMR